MNEGFFNSQCFKTFISFKASFFSYCLFTLQMLYYRTILEKYMLSSQRLPQAMLIRPSRVRLLRSTQSQATILNSPKGYPFSCGFDITELFAMKINSKPI
ncbi:Hypothetical predicted protein [Olea europaea subsp. europaea]|uniref:Uncharacterized protein n=1 Tax=Olea europaea subsp. europaea TaxID=158383 RepID=A0A8S0UNR3_OLEEU|nr:Hypothetical predicted protein [Olea europaea subsp. europaea]